MKRILIASLAAVLVLAGSRATAPAGPEGWLFAAATAAPLPDAPVLRPLTAAAQDAIVSRPPFLRAMLPQATLAYLRIPNPWGLLGPSRTAFDPALGSQPYAEVLALLRGGLGDLLPTAAPPELRALLGLLLVHARSPLELALVPPAQQGMPFPDVIIALETGLADVGEANDLLASLAAEQPLLALEQPLDDAGQGMLLLAGFPLLARYEAASGRLLLLGGAAPTPPVLDALLAEGKHSHPMHALEARVDAGGQGLFFWADPRRLLALLESTGQQGPATQLVALGLGEAEAVALGLGSAGGKGRTRAVIAMPQVGFRSMLPIADGTLEFAAAGEPESVFLARLPSAAQLATIEDALAGVLRPADLAAYRERKQEIAAALGFTVEEALAAIGPEVLLVTDGAGQYTALRLRDRAAFERIIAALSERDGARLETREIGGRRYRHLVVPPLFDLAADDPDMAALAPLLELPSHGYWIEENGYALFASVPQPLIDRAYVARRTPVAEWLAARQGIAEEGALLLASLRHHGVQPTLYQLNLQLLLALGDLVGRPVDLFALPTAREAELPRDGGYSVRIDSSADALGFELVYEHNPLELLATGNGALAIATVGLLAAVAIPAYSDYSVRARIDTAVELTEALRTGIANTYLEERRLLTREEAQALLPPYPEHVTGILYDHESGAITVVYAIEELGERNTLTLTPGTQDGRLVWECASTIPDRYLPTHCRD